MQSARNVSIGNQDEIAIDIDTTHGIYPAASTVHKHAGYEINYFTQGRARYLIGGAQYECEAGDIVLIGDEEVHRAVDGETATILVILFRPEFLVDPDRFGFETKFLAPFWGIGTQVARLIRPGSPGYEGLVQDLVALDRESREKENSYRLMLKIHLQSFAARLTRIFQIPDNSRLLENGLAAQRFAPVMAFIAEHYGQKLQVDRLAQLVNMSVNHFERTFRRSYGVSPVEYLMQARIIQGARMLVETDLRIVDVAMNCGFSSMSHFIQCFKRFNGQTPRDYRKQSFEKAPVK